MGAELNQRNKQRKCGVKMLKSYLFEPRPNPHLPHDSVEIEGTPPADARTDEEAIRNADQAVRDLMAAVAQHR